jgi:two-component system, OmpR family, aerobic respiration control sensor histidine kinase ArcB
MDHPYQLKQLLENIRDGSLFLDETYTILSASQNSATFLPEYTGPIERKNFVELLDDCTVVPLRARIVDYLKDSAGHEPEKIFTENDISVRILRLNDKAQPSGWLIIYSNEPTILDYLDEISSMMPGYFYWKDRQGRYLGCNQALLEVLGVTKDEVISNTDYDIWPEAADQLRQHDETVMKNCSLVRLEEEVEIEGVGKRYYTVVKTPLLDRHDNIIGVIGNSLDITDKVVMQQNLFTAKQEAEAVSRAKSEFIANMSHDIRTPITGMLGLIQYILDFNQDKVIQEHAKLLMSSTYELLELLNEILELVRIESGKVEDKVEAFDLFRLLDHNIKLFRSVAAHRKLDLIQVTDPNVPQFLLGLRVYLDRILLNLISNSLKFTKQGFVKVSIQVVDEEGKSKSFSKDEPVVVKVIVEDSGIGIPKDKHVTIFENFSRLTPSYEGVYKGFGLGLYTVKRYVEAMQGEVHIESEPHNGTKFILTLPFTVSDHTDRVLQHTLPTDVLSTIESIDIEAHKGVGYTPPKDPLAKVLVVEDNFVAAMMVKQLLSKLNCSVEIAETGNAALDKTLQKVYDLILMDIGLPDKSGIEVVAEIKARPNWQNIPIVALTGHLEPEKKQECLAVGMDDVLIKPVDLNLLIGLLQNLVHVDVQMSVAVQNTTIDENSNLVVDWAGCISLASGDKNFAKEMLTAFVKELSNTKQELQAAFDKEDVTKLRHEIHKFLGGLCSLRLPRLQAVTEEFQLLIKEKVQQPRFVGAAFLELLKQIDVLVEYYQQFAASGEKVD